MSSYLKHFLLFFLIFLLWQCGQGTDPEKLTAAQTKRLLTGAKSKTWKKVSEINSDSCNSASETWDFNLTDTLLIVSNNNHLSCKQMDVKSYFFVDTINKQLRLKYTLKGNDKKQSHDTIIRMITYITEREFIAEHRDLSDNIFLERFEKVNQ